MKILAIDPGPCKSAFVYYDTAEEKIYSMGHETNEKVLNMLMGWGMPDVKLAVEMIASYGMAVGKTTFETCVWIGRFIQAWHPKEQRRIYRLDCKMVLCHDSRAKDKNIRQAIIDRFPAAGGGKVPQIGIMKQPGPLYGVSGDIWAALAVAITFDETYKQ